MAQHQKSIIINKFSTEGTTLTNSAQHQHQKNYYPLPYNVEKKQNKKKNLNVYAIQVYPRSIRKSPIERRRCLRDLKVFNEENGDFKLVKLGENELRKKVV